MAGWAVNVAGGSTSGTAAGTTGISLAFGSNVTAGDVIIAGGSYGNSVSATPTFSDTSSNVTTWNTAGNFAFPSGISFNIALSWGVATTTGPCTPKMTWNSSTSSSLGLFIGDFTPPTGTISQDGSSALQNQTSSTTTVTLPAGPGSGSNDLLINYIGCQGTFTSFSSPWTQVGPSFGDGCGYVLNSAGSQAANATQSNGTYGSIIIAIQAGGGGVSTPPFIPHRMPLGV